MRSQSPTARQVEVLKAIHGIEQQHGAPPTYAQIMAALGIGSKNGVADHLKTMAKKGLVERGEKYTSRSTKITRLGLLYVGARTCSACGGSGILGAKP